MATNDDNKPSFFARYIDAPKERPAEPEVIRMGPAAATIPPASPKAHPTEKLLSWLLNHWTKPTISLREICRYGPNAIRDWESATSLSETLVQRGWLTRIETRRRDMREWQILRGPSR
jgi:transposase